MESLSQRRGPLNDAAQAVNESVLERGIYGNRLGRFRKGKSVPFLFERLPAENQTDGTALNNSVAYRFVPQEARQLFAPVPLWNSPDLYDTRTHRVDQTGRGSEIELFSPVQKKYVIALFGLVEVSGTPDHRHIV